MENILHPFCRKCTNRTSPECPKHPMHTITLHSRIKFSRLDSNQRPFVYQTKTLNHLSYVRILARPENIEIPTPSFGEKCSSSELQTCIFSICQRTIFNTKKKPWTFFRSSGFPFIYLMIRLHLIKNPYMTKIFTLNCKPILAHINREITYVMNWVLFHCFLIKYVIVWQNYNNFSVMSSFFKFLFQNV